MKHTKNEYINVYIKILLHDWKTRGEDRKREVNRETAASETNGFMNTALSPRAFDPSRKYTKMLYYIY